jgi:hypothetical protein
MITFTYIMCAIILLSIGLCVIPNKWFIKCPIDLHIVGLWLFTLSLGILIMTWVFYLLTILCKFIFITYILTWGLAA